MTTPADRVALKRAIHDRMLSLEEVELATARAHYTAFLAEARMATREVHDKDDLVGSRENADLAAAFDHPVQIHQAKIDVIENTDFAVTDRVAPGAVVCFADRRFVVATSTARFTVAGQTYMGISPQSPIYRVMVGLQAGDVFDFHGQEMEITEVI